MTTTTAACATACRQCAAQTGYGREYEPDKFLALIHISHVGELEAQGWTVVHDMYGDKGTTDVICPHIAPDVQPNG